MGGLDGGELARKRSVGFEVVHVHLGLLTIDDVGQDGVLELVVVAVRVVKVEHAFHRLASLCWSEISNKSNKSWLRISTCFSSAFTCDRRNNSSNTRQVLMLCHLTLTKHINENLTDGGLAGSGATRHPDHEGSPQGRH